MSTPAPDHARVIPLRPQGAPPAVRPAVRPVPEPVSAPREPLWRDVVGGVLRQQRLAQKRTLKDVAEQARISVPYLSELERGRKEASSEVLAAAARALGLGLAEVLSLAQQDLTRPAVSRRSRAASVASYSRGTAPAAPYNGLCLAA
ncbi:RodZ family helix-turn-helix domain-containing protein [Streptomyces sp. TLI_171]|uniref:helix-turn-helix domain-containing protein n=1 Tax=Streptomyces sp. TLI_171 TaxID=1938859 RepID=UPI000C189BD6|nr:helix-turn-helix transcriptional regulator [Streptomyces sp. TLI_171]RKE22196.1 helix-turn-helix protein [Streptomyces sp. TLI_171]